MTIQNDSGWVVVSTGRCYVRRERTVKFELLTPEAEIVAFVDAYNAEARERPFGQEDRMGLIQDGVGLTVKGVQVCDSSD